MSRRVKPLLAAALFAAALSLGIGGTVNRVEAAVSRDQIEYGCRDLYDRWAAATKAGNTTDANLARDAWDAACKKDYGDITGVTVKLMPTPTPLWQHPVQPTPGKMAPAAIPSTPTTARIQPGVSPVAAPTKPPVSR